MLDDSSSEEEYSPSTISGHSSTHSEQLTVHRPLQLHWSAASSPGTTNHGPRHCVTANIALPQDVFTQSQTRPVTILNKRQRRKQDLRRKDDASYDLVENNDPWLSYAVVGGLRRDPFNVLPVEPRDCIPNAVDHFLMTFIPERILRPFSAVPGIQHLAYDYVQLVINDLAVFEATVAQSQASFLAQQGIRKPTKEVLHHHGKALVHLQDKLADPVLAMQDATIHAILAIMGTHFFFGELDAHHSHLDGLWSLIRMRGGIETLGGNGTLRQAVETVTSFVAYSAKRETPVSSPKLSQKESSNDLDYPSHPFSAELSQTISRLPSGFTEIALKRNLSLQMISLLVDLHEQQQQQQQTDTQSANNSSRPAQRHIYAADKCLQFLQSRNMPDLERMICGGLLAYTISSQPSLPSLRTHVYDDDLQAFVTELVQYVFFNYDQEVLLWVTFCFAAVQPHVFPESVSEQGESRGKSGGDGTTEHFFHHTIMRFKQSSRWERVEAVLKQFLWTEEMVREWRERYEECVDRHRPQGASRGSTPSSIGGSACEKMSTGGGGWSWKGGKPG